jgi:hypothetical protein
MQPSAGSVVKYAVLASLVLASFFVGWATLWRSAASSRENFDFPISEYGGIDPPSLPVRQASAIHHPPSGGLSPDAPVVVNLSRISANNAARLAAMLPEWAEAIEAGTSQITITHQQYQELGVQGFDLSLMRVAAVEPAAWPACYGRLDEIYAWLAAYAEAHPDFIELYDIGDSFCKQRGGCKTRMGDVIAGREILVARITNENATSPKEGRLWIDGGMHARELPTVELVKALITYLMEGYGQDSQITYLLDHRELYAGIVINPDGRHIVELGANPPYNSGPWLWRKNANNTVGHCPGPPPTPAGEFGVDLNRNHWFKWSLPGSSDNPCSETYQGSGPSSEPEIQAYEKFVRSIFPDQRGPKDTDPAPPDTTGMLINFHNATSPGTVLVPWGWTAAKTANDADLIAIAQRYASFNGYQVDYSLYPVSGNTRDWGYGELGIPSYVIELQGIQFITPCGELGSVIETNLAPLQMMLNLCDRPYLRINGPEVTAVQAPAIVNQGQVITIRASLDKSRAGGQAVAGAEVLIGRPGGPDPTSPYPGPGRPAGQGLSMAAVDGAFDSPIENAVLQLDTAGLLPGRYYIVVRGRDSHGDWGAATATFLDVTPAR